MTETIKGDNSNRVLLTLIMFLGLIGFIVFAALYLPGFFDAGEAEDIDYGFLSYLPDEGLKTVVYVRADEDFFQELSALVGELLGGRYLKDIGDSMGGAATYEDGSTAYILYLGTAQTIDELIESVKDSGRIVDVGRKVVDGRTYHILRSYSQPLCAWEHDGGVFVLSFQDSYHRTGSGKEKRNCTAFIGKRYDAEKFRVFLTGTEDLGKKTRSDRKVDAEGWIRSIDDGTDRSWYGFSYGEDDGNYLLVAGDRISGYNAGSNLCVGGEIIRRGDKRVCLKESSPGDFSMIPMSSMVLMERGVGDYSIYAVAYTKGFNKKGVKENTLDLIFSVELEGDERIWMNKKTLNVEVIEYRTKEPVYNARVRVYSGYGYYEDRRELLREGYTDDRGLVVFTDMSLNNTRLLVTKEGYDNDTEHVSGKDTDETVYLRKPYCGDHKCGRDENCLNCPMDCECRFNEECVDGVCKREPYSIDLPDMKGKRRNINYTR